MVVCVEVVIGLTSLVILVSIADYIHEGKSRKNVSAQSSNKKENGEETGCGREPGLVFAQGSYRCRWPALGRHPPAAPRPQAGYCQRRGPGPTVRLVGAGLWRAEDAGRTGRGRTSQAAHHEPHCDRPCPQPAS